MVTLQSELQATTTESNCRLAAALVLLEAVKVQCQQINPTKMIHDLELLYRVSSPKSALNSAYISHNIVYYL